MQKKCDKRDNKRFLIAWLSHILISAHQKEMSGLCGFHVVSLMWFFLPSGFFAVDFSGYTSSTELLFSSETPQAFQKRSVGFLRPRRMTLPWPNGAGSSREPMPPHQHDQHIHLHLARIPTGDLNNRFALSKTASTILGVRQRHRKDNTFLWWYHSVYLSQYLPDVWRHSTEVDMVVSARRNWLWRQKENINP